MRLQRLLVGTVLLVLDMLNHAANRVEATHANSQCVGCAQRSTQDRLQQLEQTHLCGPNSPSFLNPRPAKSRSNGPGHVHLPARSTLERGHLLGHTDIRFAGPTLCNHVRAR